MKDDKGKIVKFYKKNTARSLRKNQSSFERILWQELRRKNMFGVKFRRQHPLGKYIADFFCFEKKLIIELDGPFHEDKVRKIYDIRRQSELEKMGYKVIRFKNEEIINNFEKILTTIENLVTEK